MTQCCCLSWRPPAIGTTRLSKFQCGVHGLEKQTAFHPKAVRKMSRVALGETRGSWRVFAYITQGLAMVKPPRPNKASESTRGPPSNCQGGSTCQWAVILLRLWHIQLRPQEAGRHDYYLNVSSRSAPLLRQYVGALPIFRQMKRTLETGSRRSGGNSMSAFEVLPLIIVWLDSSS